MPYNRDLGIIYYDSPTDPNLGVSIADVQSVCPVTIKRTVNGVEERRSSSDVGVLCGGKVGNTVPDNQGGTAWTIASRVNINKWATFKPMPTGSVVQIYRNATAPYGLRTIYQRVNPYTGAVSPSTNTTFATAIEALRLSILGGQSNPFLDDLVMYVPPEGQDGSAYRLTDFVCTQSVRGTNPIKGQRLKHGYKRAAILRYGYHDQGGVYHGLIGRSLGVNSNGEIVADGNQNIDQTATEVWGENFYDLDTRLNWAKTYDDENSLCVLDWLDAMYSIRGINLHRAVCLFTNDMIEQSGFVAVGIIPWAAGSGSWANAIMGDPTRVWHCVEFLTNAPVTSDFAPISSWNNNAAYSWMFIPGLISKNLHVAGSDPYLIGAEFLYADTNQFSPYGFNLFVKIRSMGLNTELKVFVSTSPNPDSIYDYVMNRVWSFTVTSVGQYNIYGSVATNICPSDITSGNYRKFNEVFTVGATYYICIWGQANATDSSQRVIWSQSAVATRDDMLQIVY